jgi:hypothetical protein
MSQTQNCRRWSGRHPARGSISGVPISEQLSALRSQKLARSVFGLRNHFLRESKVLRREYADVSSRRVSHRKFVTFTVGEDLGGPITVVYTRDLRPLETRDVQLRPRPRLLRFCSKGTSVRPNRNDEKFTSEHQA